MKEKYNFIHIKSDYNTKYFGRFSICFNFPVDICIIMDDDIVPGINCLKNYIEQHLETNAIIGGNGRFAFNNIYSSYSIHNIKNKKLIQPPETGIRKENILADFVGHLWCFKKDWLYYMFAIKPFTFDTGEDMHLCFSCKILGNIESYTCKQENPDDNCDIYNNKLANDKFSSYKSDNRELRINVENYFINNYNLKFISSD